MLRFGSSDSLKNVGLLGAGKVHNNLAIVGPDTKSRVVFGLDRCWGFFNVSEAEYIIHRCAQT